MGSSYESAAMAGDPESPAVISCGLPWLTPECSSRWLGNRILIWPDGIPPHRRISIVSSRLRRRLDLESWWFDLLRTTVLRCDGGTDILCAVNDSTAFEATVRASELFGRPLLRFQIPSASSVLAQADMEAWRDDVVERSKADSTRQKSVEQQPVWSAIVSPELIAAGDCPVEEKTGDMLPLADRLMFAAADRLHVLSCRKCGNLAGLLKVHCQDQDRHHIPVLIASDEQGRIPESIRGLPDRWVPWLVRPFSKDIVNSSDDSPAVHTAAPGGTTSLLKQTTNRASSPLSQPSDWLLHWTRPSPGPWPGESRTEFLDSLILGCETKDRSALAALLKIISDGVLRASREGIRGGHAVVSFTQVPLNGFRARRVFRKHRQRFDFEPWGLAIRRSALVAAGGRPVVYGYEADWTKLPSAEHPFFQKATSGGSTDNLAEQEWRVASDLNLRSLPPESVGVFTDTAEAAALIRRHCVWDVFVVPLTE